LARLVDHRLSDHRRALAAMERATEIEPKNPELQLEAAALYERAHEPAAAKAHYLAALEAGPLDPEVHHRLWSFFAFSGDQDRAFQTAAILDGLDAATDEEKDLYRRLASEQPPRPARPMEAPDWMLGLEPGARDPALTTLLELVSDAALQAHRLDRDEIAALRSRTELEHVATSTTTLARSLAWAADFLGVPRPALYVEAGATPPRPLPIHEPAWVVGRDVGRGVPVLELVFHWACALARTSGTARVTRLYPGDRVVDVLAACFVAIKRPTEHKGEGVMNLALHLRQELDREALHSLASLLDGQDYDGWVERTRAFATEVTRCSNRTGLLACGNPRLAARALTARGLEPGALEEQIVDLFCFAMSDSYAALRKRLGLAF
jgi:hypothetical protein